MLDENKQKKKGFSNEDITVTEHFMEVNFMMASEVNMN